jgi:LuxR family quorum-sensing system transcriptional regulator CciR
MFDRLEAFVREVSGADDEEALREILAEHCDEMGFAYFALTHHVDVLRAPRPVIRLHNYPSDWADWFDAEKLGPSDPVHRASHLTMAGFAWSRLPSLIQLTPRDRLVLELAARQGIGDGFTVPANIPGESHGSCSFATRTGAALPQDQLLLAQLIGTYAFERARGIWQVRAGPLRPLPQLTDRQRDCVIWVARGKTDTEIAQILDVTSDTVGEHLRHARDRYGVVRRTSLAIHALYDGAISFTDIMGRGHPPFL